MGFRLYITETPKDYKSSLEFRKFYGYCDYKYAKDSFEYLYSICGDELKDYYALTYESIEDMYDIIACLPYTGKYHLTADQFRIFISKYIAGMQWWYKDKGNTEKLTLYSFDELPDLYADECDKYIEWG